MDTPADRDCRPTAHYTAFCCGVTSLDTGQLHGSLIAFRLKKKKQGLKVKQNLMVTSIRSLITYTCRMLEAA